MEGSPKRGHQNLKLLTTQAIHVKILGYLGSHNRIPWGTTIGSPHQTGPSKIFTHQAR